MRIVADNATITFCFNTKRFTTGAPFTLAGSPSMYARVDGNATEVTTGFTLTADFDSKTGLNNVILDLSASASYTAGSLVEIFIGAGTVDSVSVADTKVYEFEIGNTGSQQQANTRVMLGIPAAAGGASGGLMINGTNAGNIVYSGTWTQTGHMTYLDGWSIPVPSTLNRDGMKVSGNGTGEAINLTAGATAYAISFTAGDHEAIGIFNDSTSSTIFISNNDTGNLLTFNGDGGISAINTDGNFTGNLLGVLSTLTTYTGNTPQTGDSFAIVNSGTFGNAALKTLIDAIASGALSAADVWSYVARTVTAATNITSTGGTTVPQTGDTYALANGASGFVALKAVVDAILLDTGTDGVVISSATRDAIATSLLDLAAGVETGITFRQFCRAVGAVVVGLLPSGAGTGTEAFKGIGQASGGTTRVTNTVDNDGNRTAQTLNL